MAVSPAKQQPQHSSSTCSSTRVHELLTDGNILLLFTALPTLTQKKIRNWHFSEADIRQISVPAEERSTCFNTVSFTGHVQCSQNNCSHKIHHEQSNLKVCKHDAQTHRCCTFHGAHSFAASDYNII
jgi:hypothetical protein